MRRLFGLGIILYVLIANIIGVYALGDDITYSDDDYYYDTGNYNYSDYYDDDYYNDDRYGYGGYGGSSSTVWLYISIAIFAIGAYSIRYNEKNPPTPYRSQNNSRRDGWASNTVTGTATYTLPAVKEESIQKLRQAHPDFSTAEIESMIKKWVFDFEASWCKGNMMPQKEFICDDLFYTYQAQLDRMRELEELSYTQDLAVTNCYVEEWIQDGKNELLNVIIIEQKRNCKVNLYSNQIVKGNLNVTYILYYRWQLMRTKEDNNWRLNKVDKLHQIP